MKLYLKFDINTVCKKVLQQQLEEMELPYSIIAFGEVDLREPVAKEKLKQLNANLEAFGIEVVESQKSILIQKIKDAIIEMVYTEEKLTTSKTSAYLSTKLKRSYGYISKLFSDVTYTSIENFIILQKIERAKQLMTTSDLNFTEIAWKLNYSSVAHFSNQFKNSTGLTPSAFQRIISKRRNIINPAV